MTTHSLIVGGSSAKRVMHCPGSVTLAAQAVPRPPGIYADEGTLLHNTIAEILKYDYPPEVFLGKTYGTASLTQELIDDKLMPALALFDAIDADKTMDFQIEQRVDFGNFLPGVFGSADIIGRRGDTAIVLDWKFGSGVMVDAEQNDQLLFYAAAAARTEATRWAFAGATEVELIIIQPPQVRRWTTTMDRLKRFEVELRAAVNMSTAPDAPLAAGDWCRWCPASVTCPQLTGQVDRVIRTRLKEVDPLELSDILDKAVALEEWMDAARELATRMLNNGAHIPGFKLVQKRAARVWTDEDNARATLAGLGLGVDAMYDTKFKTPAAMEKALKQKLPSDLVTAVSSGTTLAPESDPRPAVPVIGVQLKQALTRI